MSFRLSAHAVGADKGDLAHYTGMTWVPPDCRGKAEHFPNGTDFCPQEAEGYAGTCHGCAGSHSSPSPRVVCLHL